MKQTFFIFLLLFSFCVAAQKKTKHKKEGPEIDCGKWFMAGMNYAVDIPNTKKMPFMNTAKGVEWMLMIKPVKKFPLWLTWNFGTGTYGKQSFSQPWNAPVADTILTGNAVYRSRFHKLFFGLRFTTRNENARWHPYVDVGAGYVKFISTVKIKGDVTHQTLIKGDGIQDGDIDDNDHYEQRKQKFKEEKQTYCCGTYVWTAGAGIQMRITDDLENRNGVNSYFDFSVNYIGAIDQQAKGLDFFKGQVCYVNDNYMKDQIAYPPNGDPARDPNAGYVNVSPESIPQKKLAKLSYSPLSIFSVKLGYVIRF